MSGYDSPGPPVYRREAEPEPIRFQPLGEIRREAPPTQA